MLCLCSCVCEKCVCTYVCGVVSSAVFAVGYLLVVVVLSFNKGNTYTCSELQSSPPRVV